MILDYIAHHNDFIKWKHFPRYWPFVRSPVNSPHRGQWRGALMFSLTGDKQSFEEIVFTDAYVRYSASCNEVQMIRRTKNIS